MQSPTTLAGYCISILRDELYSKLLPIASKDIKEKRLFLGEAGLPTYTWQRDNVMDYIHEHHIPFEIMYKILDKETTHCLVQFHSNAAVICRLEDGLWTYHNVMVIKDKEGWYPTIDEAKQSFALKKNTLLDDDQYWKLYQVFDDEPVIVKKRSVEVMIQDDEDSYWDMY